MKMRRGFYCSKCNRFIQSQKERIAVSRDTLKRLEALRVSSKEDPEDVITWLLSLANKIARN
jgi:flavodoxin